MKKTQVLAVGLTLVLASCGQKGDLYLPKEPSQQTASAGEKHDG